MDDQSAMKLKILQANLESVVGDLNSKTKECDAAQKDLLHQRELVGQIDKKLNALAKTNKQLEKENARFLRARDEMVGCEVQTEPDAVLVAAEAVRDVAVAAKSEAEAAAALAWTEAATQVEEERSKAQAATRAELEVARAAVAAAEAKVAESEAARAASAAEVEEARTAAGGKEAEAREAQAAAASAFAAELNAVKEKLRLSEASCEERAKQV